jgi:hypothetical protein
MRRRRTRLIWRTKAPKPAFNTFEHRYAAMETRRIALATRLGAQGEDAKQCPAYKMALTLLNETFRKERLAQRAGILQSAAWLLDVLEKMTMAV